MWNELPERVGVEAAQQFYDQVAWTPGESARVNRTSVLRGKAGRPRDGFSHVIHYELSGAGRLDYRYHNSYDTGSQRRLSPYRPDPDDQF